MAFLSNQTRLDKTVRIFNEFYSFETIVKANEYDVVKSFFLSVSDDEEIADNFTIFLFKISQETGINVMELLSQLDGNTQIDINKIIAYYMNSFKSKTSLYGVAQIPQPNMAVYRNVIE